MAVATEVNLRSLIKEFVEDSKLADPHEIAQTMLDENYIDSSIYYDALVQTLPNYVREILRLHRGSTIQFVRSGHENNSGRWQNAIGGQPGERLLRTRHNTGTKWVVLAEMTREDVQGALGECERRIASETLQADRWRNINKLFDRHKKAPTVGDLPLAKVEEVYL